jgi:hypothetical protein
MLKVIIPAVVLIAVGILLYSYLQPAAVQQQDLITAEVRKGKLEIVVDATGELQAKRSVKIRGPQGMRAAGIYQTTIQDLVAEGTIVEEGDYVGKLDRSELATRISTVQTELEKVQTQLEQAKIDTAIEMRGLRDELVNLRFSLREKKLQVEQSQFEAPSVIRQTELEMERVLRDIEQSEQKYVLKQQQSIAKIQEIDALVRQNQMRLNMYLELSDEFDITAPKPGMVIYARERGGKKQPGDQISAWDPVVAELPDLTDMISQTYVNEVDISKVKRGQEVQIQVDAFPERRYTGKVIKVANIGEQMSGYDAKVFEVTIQVDQSDSIMRPAMTTSNGIIIDTYEDVVAIPIEALQSDSLTFVYKKEGGRTVRQEVMLGSSNDEEVIIAFGLSEGDQIYLVAPEGGQDLPFATISEADKMKVKKQLREDEKRRQALAEERQRSVAGMEAPGGGGGGGGGRVIFR